MVYLPLLGAVLEAFGTILEKNVLKRRDITFRNYIVFSFLAIVLVLLPVVYFFHTVQPEAFFAKNIGIFIFIVLVSIVANVLILYSLKRESISEFEPIWLMQPLFTILLAFVFYQDERQWEVIALALIASISLVAAHVKRHHLTMDRYMVAAYLGSFLFAVELVASKTIISLYNPFFFYFLRCLCIFALAIIIFRPSFKIFGREQKLSLLIIGIGVLWAVYRAIVYYGYDIYGVVTTTLLFMLSPVLMLIFAAFFLGERPTARQIISTAIITLCVIIALVLQNYL
ncbi:DMT family transporter [Candidatus Pacearchaeota archaeon]|nr:DMT family transporter [Candidatus Pacearchaeota archaeon]